MINQEITAIVVNTGIRHNRYTWNITCSCSTVTYTSFPDYFLNKDDCVAGLWEYLEKLLPLMEGKFALNVNPNYGRVN